jgi:hypothetical protein
MCLAGDGNVPLPAEGSKTMEMIFRTAEKVVASRV